MRLILLFVLLFLGPTDALWGQAVELGGAEDDSTSIVLQEILDRGNYIVMDRDTVLGEDVSLAGDLVVVDARVALEGSVAGSVAVVSGDFFARPGSRVGGRILVFGGGAYPSALADVGEVVYLDPSIETELQVRTGGYGLTLIPSVSRIFRIPGVLGFAPPTYDRVDGLSILWGSALVFGGDSATISILGSAAYRTARERLNAGLELRVRASPRARISLAASRSTRTNEEWIRGAFSNSVSSAFVGSDVRNYYESDEVSASIIGLPPPPLIEGEGFISPRLVLRLSQDRSLKAESPWALWGADEWRPNPEIDTGTLGSAVGGATFGWRGMTSRFSGAAGVEWSPGGIGDFRFAQLEASGDWWMLGPYMHQIEIFAYLLQPLGSGYVPRQRWSFVGGPGTLPTFPTGSLRGDHLLFLRSSYTAEVRQLQLPLVGPPSLRLEYAAGTAWEGGTQRPPLEQNIGAGVQLLIFTGMIHVDPAQTALDPVFSFGATLRTPAGGSVF